MCSPLARQEPDGRRKGNGVGEGSAHIWGATVRRRPGVRGTVLVVYRAGGWRGLRGLRWWRRRWLRGCRSAWWQGWHAGEWECGARERRRCGQRRAEPAFRWRGARKGYGAAALQMSSAGTVCKRPCGQGMLCNCMVRVRCGGVCGALDLERWLREWRGVSCGSAGHGVFRWVARGTLGVFPIGFAGRLCIADPGRVLGITRVAASSRLCAWRVRLI